MINYEIARERQIMREAKKETDNERVCVRVRKKETKFSSILGRSLSRSLRCPLFARYLARLGALYSLVISLA
jgi:hypothetical protein